jgi:hypothetical protein
VRATGPALFVATVSAIGAGTPLLAGSAGAAKATVDTDGYASQQRRGLVFNLYMLYIHC